MTSLSSDIRGALLTVGGMTAQLPVTYRSELGVCANPIQRTFTS
jgi:hypothetical protein